MTTHHDIEIKLSDKQQLLLSRFCDGECGCVERFLAKRLLARSGDAQSFLREMESLRDCCRSTLERSSQSLSTPTTSTADLWERINIRIEQESRAEIYLGKRIVEQQRESIWERLLSTHTLAGSVSGAALAGLLLFFVYRPATIISFSAPQTAHLGSNNFVQQVGLGASGYTDTNSGAHIQSPLQVDWLRSHGSLSLIPAPDGRSAIIWVRRRPAQLQKPTIREVRQRNLGAAPPVVTIPATPRGTLRPLQSKQWLDEHAETSAK